MSNALKSMKGCYNLSVHNNRLHMLMAALVQDPKTKRRQQHISKKYFIILWPFMHLLLSLF